MSSFSNEQSKKKWADYEDSDSEEEETSPVVPKTEESGNLNEVSDDEDEEESEDELDLSKIQVKSTETAGKSENKSNRRNLSKKEIQELKKKELEDLENLLAQYREDPSTTESAAPSSEVQDRESEAVNGEKAENGHEDTKLKKKKKKKASAAEKTGVEASEVPAEKSPADIAAVLKARASKKTNPSKKATVDPLKIAIEEAAKSSTSNGKKKKRDKSKFNETSY